MSDNVISTRQVRFCLAAPVAAEHDYPMTNRSATTLLPVPTRAAMRRAESDIPKLAPVSSERMAEAEAANEEVCRLAEEISRVMRKPKPGAKRNARRVRNPDRATAPVRC